MLAEDMKMDKELEMCANSSHDYPDRPGEPDCIYYLRTGTCGYGNNCRFNHPPQLSLSHHTNQLPQRPGQPDCQYFLKTGTCKFGAACKYHHPRDKNLANQVPLNVYSLPMRQEEKSCPYYMRTWSCKFGLACKFHHPQPDGVCSLLPVSGSPAYGSTGASVVSSSGMSYVGELPAWYLQRAPSIPGLPLQSPQAYMPLIFSPSLGITPAQQRWNTYVGESGSAGHVGLLFESVPHYPERSEQPECQFYMKSGRCKFGFDCKYHHPKERHTSAPISDLGAFGLPLRPGHAVCNNYSMYGMCKFGSTCKFDHPWLGFYNYGVSMPTISIVDPSFMPNLKASPLARSSKTPHKSSKLSDIANLDATCAEQKETNTKAPDDPPSSEQANKISD